MGAFTDWTTVSLVVCDLDGTLYDQRKLRAYLLPRLGLHALRRTDVRLLRIIAKLRSERERLAELERSPFEAELIASVSAATGASLDRVRSVLSEWLEARPLDWLGACVIPGAARFLDALRASGRYVAVLSDYPAVEKLVAMGLSADLALSATDPEIAIQKPSIKGLAHLAAHFGVSPEAVLVIGDRDDRDGEAARRFGAQYLIRGRDFKTFEDMIFTRIPL
jgi:FMN phosphatase YigB (HAD superfamily)